MSSAAQIGIQVTGGIIEILKAYNIFKAQHPDMTEEQALIAFARGVGAFNEAVADWRGSEPPSQT